MTRGCSPCWRRSCRRPWTGRRHSRGSRSTTSSITACWRRRWPGCPADDAAQVRDACARWSRLRFAVDATAYPGRTRGAPRAGSTCTTAPAAAGAPARPRPAGSTSSPRRSGTCAPRGPPCSTWPAPRPRPARPQTIAQVRNVLRRLRAAGHGRKAAPLFVFNAGYSAAALTDGLAGCPVHVLVRLAAGSVFYAEPVTWEGKYGRPARRGPQVHCLEPADSEAAARAPGRGAGRSPCPRTLSRTRTLTLPGHPALRHRPRRGLARRAPPHPRRPRLVRREEETAGPARRPRPRHRRAPARRPGPAPRHVAVACRPRPPVPGRALARLPRTLRHRARLQALQGHPRAHRREDP